jgi:hypothetical protein
MEILEILEMPELQVQVEGEEVLPHLTSVPHPHPLHSDIILPMEMQVHLHLPVLLQEVPAVPVVRVELDNQVWQVIQVFSEIPDLLILL